MFFASFITSSLSSPSPPADYPPYFWPLPTTFSFGNQTFFVDPAEYLTVGESGGGSSIVSAPFERYMGIIFNHASSKERHESSVKVSPERTTLSTLNKPLSTTPKWHTIDPHTQRLIIKSRTLISKERTSGSNMEGETAAKAAASSSSSPSRYESQKRRDWNTFLQYLRNHKPPLNLSRCSGAHVLEFLKYLDQFGKTKVHATACPFFGQPNPPSQCTCPLKQAWGSLDALIGRLRAAFEEIGGGLPESNPFAAKAVRIYLKEVRQTQAKARGIPYDKKKRKRPHTAKATPIAGDGDDAGGSSGAALVVTTATTV